jgi:glycosyltransferase involved in cell wall biosynthesis
MKILMVSTEYPPMKGGVAHYSQKLVGSLRNEGLEVSVVCNEHGNGDFRGISPYNRHNSDLLIKAVKEFKPDVVHVQYEQGLYGLHLDPINPKRTGTTIEPFYHVCKLPIVTTFHSAYSFTQWMRLIVPSVEDLAGWEHFYEQRMTIGPIF